ncbi:MAG: HAD family phosphatase [Kofleriaceae bacterium]|nr:HAD family phosphatase [Kofleriaceae bacterium]
MAAKLLALDLDGTLLRKDGSIDPVDLAAIARVQAQGVIVTIATGRMYAGTRAAALAIAANGPVACVDGSAIIDVRNDRVVHRTAISSTLTAHALATFDAHDLAMFAFCDHAIVHNAAGDPFARYVATWSPTLERVERVENAVQGYDSLATLAVGTQAQIAQAAAVIVGHSGERLFTVQFAVSHSSSEKPGLHALLVRAAGCSKGTAITALGAHHGISVADIVVVGDWLNDISMFRVAGRSFAMAGSPVEVAAAATDQLAAMAAHGGGVAEAIARVWP